MQSKVIAPDFAAPRLRSQLEMRQRRRALTERIREEEQRRRLDRLQRFAATGLTTAEINQVVAPLEFRLDRIPFARPIRPQLVMLAGVITVAIMSVIITWVR